MVPGGSEPPRADGRAERRPSSEAHRTDELERAARRFGRALKGARIVIAAQDLDLVYRWVSGSNLGMAAEDVVGHLDSELFEAPAAAALDEVKRRVLTDGQPQEIEIGLMSPVTGERHWLRIHVEPSYDDAGMLIGVQVTEIDVSEARRREEQLRSLTGALAEAHERFDSALRGSDITVSRQDRELNFTWVFNAPAGLSSDAMVGHTDEEMLPLETARQLLPVKRRVLATSVPERVETAIPVGQEVRTYDVRIEPIFLGDNAVGVTSVAVDITRIKNSERHLRVVMRELTHRSKNLLAVVQGIARQTAQSSRTVDGFVDRFGGRLQALARAHDILVDEAWRGASLRELVAAQIGHFENLDASRFNAQGEDVLLRPEAAQNIALALHELATNAAKYGALSVPSGRVHVGWGTRPEAEGMEGPVLELSWREQHGPVVSPPDGRGFGRVMLERIVPRAIDGSASLEFAPDGLVWLLRFPMSYVVTTDVDDASEPTMFPQRSHRVNETPTTREDGHAAGGNGVDRSLLRR